MMNTKLKGIDTRQKYDIYNIANSGKIFLSIDIIQANFTILRDLCPSIFVKDSKVLSWYKFVKNLTKSEFIAKSKYFRELVFGNTGFIGKSGTYQEIFIDTIHNLVCEMW